VRKTNPRISDDLQVLSHALLLRVPHVMFAMSASMASTALASIIGGFALAKMFMIDAANSFKCDVYQRELPAYVIDTVLQRDTRRHGLSRSRLGL